MKNNKLIDTLQNLGLSDHESRVYLACLSLGPSTILQIAKIAEVKRTTVYNVIESLKQLGLIHVDIRGFKQLYVADNPEKLEVMVNARRDELISSLPEFMGLYNLKGGESFIRYYEGSEACKSVYNNIILETKYGEDLLIVSNQENWQQHDAKFFSDFVEGYSKKGLSVRKLLQTSSSGTGHRKHEAKYNEKIKPLPLSFKLSANLFITPRKVVIHQLIPPILAIEIENNSVVRMNKEMFEMVWHSIPDSSHAKATFETFAGKQYQELEDALREVIRDKSNILDVGGVAGNIVKMIDKISDSCHVKILNNQISPHTARSFGNLKSTTYEIIEKDPNIYFKVENQAVDLMIFNACLHEICSSDDQKSYLDLLFTDINKHLKPDGKIIIGDFYYDPSIPQHELQLYIQYLINTVGHADPPNKSINPDYILEIAQKHGYKILHFHQNRMVKEIDRKYYVFVLEKKT